MAKRIKTGGRQKGTPNKSTIEIRSLLSGILCHEIECIPEYIAGIQPEKKLLIIIKLLPYILPISTEQPEVENKETPVEFVQRIQNMIKAKKEILQ